MCSQDDEFQGYHIPKGSIMYVSPFEQLYIQLTLSANPFFHNLAWPTLGDSFLAFRVRSNL